MTPTLKNLETKYSCRNAVHVYIIIWVKLWPGKEQLKT